MIAQAKWMGKKVWMFMALLMVLMAGSTGMVCAAALTEEEADALLLMREEEKLARDVYLQLYNQYGLRIFSNIAKSEQTHMNAVKTLLDRYGLEDPAAGKGVGEFENAEIKLLHDQLLESGMISPANALQVGIDIEETDIDDLENALAITKRRDIRKVFTNLIQGSYNHLEAFTRVLASVAPAAD